MLKKSKRTLSLVLALIMICSTLGVMAFAAENIDGAVYEFYDEDGVVALQTTSDMGNTYSTNCTVYVSGSWHPGDGSFCWLDYECVFSGPLSENFSWGYVSGGGANNTVVMAVYYAENYDSAERVYTIKVIFDEDDSLSVKCYRGSTTSGTPYATTSILVDFIEA